MTTGEWVAQHPERVMIVKRESSLDEVVELLLQRTGWRDVYVVSENRVVGHVSHRKLAHLILAEHRGGQARRQIRDRVSEGKAQDFMDSQFASARADEQLDSVLSRMLEHDLEDLPVLDHQGHLVGAINLTVVLKVVAAGQAL